MRHRILGFGIVRNVQMRMILVEEDRFHPRPLDVEWEREARIYCLCVKDGAFPVTMVDLSRANQGNEAWRINIGPQSVLLPPGCHRDIPDR